MEKESLIGYKVFLKKSYPVLLDPVTGVIVEEEKLPNSKCQLIIRWSDGATSVHRKDAVFEAHYQIAESDLAAFV